MKVVKIPSSLGGLKNARGSEKAPDRIAEHLNDFYFTEQGGFPLLEIGEVKISKSNLTDTNTLIFDKIKAVKENFIALGGDHSITHPCFRAFSQNFENAGIVVFDAHPDMMQPFDIPSHENFLRMLIEEGFVDKQNVLVVGVRNWDKEELKFLKEQKIKYYSMSEITREGRESVCDAVMAAAKDFGALYLSLDIDVVDAAFVPGTGHPEPAGLTPRELLYFVQRLKLLKNLKAVDIVEVNPEKDINDVTARLAAKLVVELS